MILSNISLFVFSLIQEGAAEGAAEGPPPPDFLIPMLLVGLIFWFIVIGPERKKRKQRDSMVEALKKGDKIMTTTGMYATVAQVQGDIITLQIADGVRVKFAVAAIQGKVDPEQKKDDEKKPKGDDKPAEVEEKAASAS